MLEQNNETTTPGNLEPGDRALADLAALGDRFCMYRSEVRTRGDGTEVKTKIPYVPGTLDRAKSNDSTTWRSFAVADAAMETGQYDGTLIALGSVGRHFLVGIDIDSCLSEIDGVTEVAAWARPYLDLLKATYVEVSPSRTGCKAFFFVRGLAINEVRRAFGIKEGASSRSVQIEQTGKAHPPAVELHFDRRFYALTKFYWNESADHIATLEPALLQQIAALLPQGERTATAQDRGAGGGSGAGNFDGRQSSWDSTRSGHAWRLALSHADNDDDYAGFCRGLSMFLPTWYAENGPDSHQCRRTWERAAAQVAPTAWRRAKPLLKSFDRRSVITPHACAHCSSVCRS